MRRLWLVATASLIILGNVATASAQVDAQVGELNSQALEAYQALDIDTARAKLEQAISMAQQAGYAGPAVAQSYMNLGVVYIAGMNDRDQGLGAFLSALCMQGDVQLDPLLSTPDVQVVFTQAQQDARGGACGPGAVPMAPAAPPPPGVAPTPGMMAPYTAGPQRDIDAECPPGVVCNSDGSTKGPNDWARFFFNVQFAAGLAWVGPGMKTDSGPPAGEILKPRIVNTDTNDDGFINDLDDENMDDLIDTTERFFFNDKSAWVPDADSYDDFEKVDTMSGRIEIPRGITPLSTSCSGDGKETGPADVPGKNDLPYPTIEPSSYCARVPKSGFVVNPALRLNLGYFITQSFALSVPLRFQFSAGKGSLSHMLIGLRGELAFSAPETATGIPISWFFGGSYGQVQAKPPPKDPKRAAPYVISGPFGINTGLNARFRVHRNFGFIVSPEIDVLLPDFLFNIDLSAGVEAAF
jgi:hypothetical protein